MSSSFETLIQFLEHYDLDVEGRSSQDPPPEIRAKLGAFACGKLEPEQQRELLALLNLNPCWIGILADEVKALRTDTSPKP
jgi:hypothetical protein